MSGELPVYVEVTTTLAARFTAGYERVVRSVLAGMAGPAGAGLETIPVTATGRSEHRRLTSGELEVLGSHPAGGTNRRRAERFGPLSPVIRGTVGLPAVARMRNVVARQRRRLTLSPSLRGLNIGIPPIGSVWLDLEPAWNDPAPRSQLLTRLQAEGIHSAVLIADVMPELFPEWFDSFQVRRFGEWLQAHLEHSGLFLCISANTEADLCKVARTRGITADLNTVVVPLGGDLPDAEPTPIELPPQMGRFLLVVGTLEPRKNQALVLEAFSRLKHRHDDLGLVLVGRQGWLVEDLVEAIRSNPEYGKRLVWPDAVDDSQLAWLYRNAFLTVAPSRYEGLGVPVMEALAAGCATISSTGGALPEAGAGRVETFHPDDVDALCVLVERHLLDPAHHERRRALAMEYDVASWDDTTAAVAGALLALGRHEPPKLGDAGRGSDHGHGQSRDGKQAGMGSNE